MKKVYVITILALLITTPILFACLSLATASSFFDRPEMLPTINIERDGNISPPTDLIKRDGNTYTLTANAIEKPIIIIQRDNSIFDGAGYNITVLTGPNPALIVIANDTSSGPINNVVVKNVGITSNNIYTFDFLCSGGFIENVQTNKAIRIYGDANKINKCDIGNFCIFQGKDNVITKCNIFDILVSGRSNMFFANNFFLSEYPSLFMESTWDNGSLGNYWGNYSARYPNASEIDNTGIADTPYFIERDEYTSRDYPDEDNNVDRFPLLYPYDINKDQIAFPTLNPDVPDFSFLVIIPLLLSMFAVAVLVRHRKTAVLSK